MTPAIDPIRRFEELLAEASSVDRDRLPEPTAFALGTVGADGRPSVRMLLLKGVENNGFVFYTNLESRKGRELEMNPKAAMTFHWQPLEIQVRIEGDVAPVDAATADLYFGSRPRGSQLGAWASLQSRAIEQPGDLERRMEELERRYSGRAVPRPPYWSGFTLVPHRIEFWKARPNRLHDRKVYDRQGAAWTETTLYP